MHSEIITLQTPLSWHAASRFPLQNPSARREVLIGGAWMLIPPLGWLLNMGQRVMMVHNMQHGQPAWPAWNNYPQLLKHGLLTFVGMLSYHAPSLVVGWFAGDSALLWSLSAALFLLATVAVPGYMTHYCKTLDAAEIFNPLRALARVKQGGWAYWRAWGNVLTALPLSFLGLLGFGVGFFFTSVWFWQVAGFSFATVFTKRFELSTTSRS